MKRIVGYSFLFLAWALNGAAIISHLLFGTLQSTPLSVLRSGLYILLIIGGVHHFWPQSISDDSISGSNIKSIEMCVTPENPFPVNNYNSYDARKANEMEGGRYAGFEWRSSIESGQSSTCISDQGPAFEDGCFEYERQEDTYEACKRRNR